MEALQRNLAILKGRWIHYNMSPPPLSLGTSSLPNTQNCATFASLFLPRDKEPVEIIAAERSGLVSGNHETPLASLRAFGDWLGVEVRFGKPPTTRAVRAAMAAYGDRILDETAMMYDCVVTQNDAMGEDEEKGLLEPFLDEMGRGFVGDDIEKDVKSVFDTCLRSHKGHRVDDTDLLGYGLIDSWPCRSPQPDTVCHRLLQPTAPPRRIARAARKTLDARANRIFGLLVRSGVALLGRAPLELPRRSIGPRQMAINGPREKN